MALRRAAGSQSNDSLRKIIRSGVLRGGEVTALFLVQLASSRQSSALWTLRCKRRGGKMYFSSTVPSLRSSVRPAEWTFYITRPKNSLRPGLACVERHFAASANLYPLYMLLHVHDSAAMIVEEDRLATKPVEWKEASVNKCSIPLPKLQRWTPATVAQKARVER